MESFNKFKKKIMLEVLLKSIMSGLSIGLISFSLPFIYIKVKGIEFNILLLVLIAFGILLVTFGLSYLFLKPNKIMIAKRIDKELSLNQKVQTMIEYEKEDNFMINLQRENTLSILDGISIKNLSMKLGIFAFIILGLSCACCITSFAIPAYEEPEVIIPTEETPDLDYELDNWQAMAILGIIEVVEESDIDDGLKTKYIDSLNGLLNDLEDASKVSQMKTIVIGVIDYVKLELDKLNTNNEIFSVLRQSDNSLITQLGVKINVLNSDDVYNLFDNFKLQVTDLDSLKSLDSSFGKLLRNSNLNKEDLLCKYLIEFCDDLKNIQSGSDITESVGIVVVKHREKIIDEINKQAINSEIALYIEEELVEIFGLYEDVNDDDFEDDDPNFDEDDDKKNENQDNQGGLGTGDVIFGSNDLFFDPNEGQVEYGDVITKYYGELMSKINDGTISEEERKYLEQYFDILFGDFNKNEE